MGRALRAYAPDTLAVFGVEFGHTDPQLVTPYGGAVRVDGPARRVIVTYRAPARRSVLRTPP